VKGLCLCGLQGVERQVGLVRGTRWATRSSAGRMVAKRARRCRGGARERGVSYRGLFVSHKTKVGAR
jgi:hypothetical protein